ncbi:MAG: hypothetical protein QOE20_1501 [Mycobacterium sp.]|nr:hypothetical protein [Mycobacterium sp.]
MGLTLADLDRWDPEAVHSVFAAATARAADTRTTATAVGDVMTAVPGEGQAHDAATQATGRVLADLTSHAADCDAVGRAAETAEGEIRAVKDSWRKILRMADRWGISINIATNELSYLPPADPKAAAEQARRLDTLHAEIEDLLRRANNADADLAAAIRGAAGLESARDIDEQLHSHGNDPTADRPAASSPPLPPANSSPKDVKRWWDALSPEQQAAALREHPAEIGKLDGVPASVREQLNANWLPAQIAKQQTIIAAAGPNLRANTPPANAVNNAVAKLRDLQAIQSVLKTPGTHLLLLDADSNPNMVLAAIASGDVDNAQRVGVTVGGMTTRVSDSVGGMTGEVIAQQNEAIGLRRAANVPHPESVATVAWLGYAAPGMNFDITDDDLARAGAGPLNRFYNGLAATTNLGDQQHITAFGHSYGSLVTSLALQQGTPVQDVVLYGSPGGELSNAAQLGVAPGHAFYELGVNDGVPTTIASTHAFGAPLQEVPGFTPLSVNSGEGHDGQWHERAYGHSEYARNGANGQLRMSGYNLAAVLSGVPDTTVAPPHLPPATIPLGLGPFGIPVPNPDYHP